MGRLHLVSLVLIVPLVILITGVTIFLVLFTSSSSSIKMGNITMGELSIEPGHKLIHVQIGHERLFSANIGRTVGENHRQQFLSDDELRIEWPDTQSLLTVKRWEWDKLIELHISWTTLTLYTFEDALHLRDGHWYGGAQAWAQRFPIESMTLGVLPYVTSDIYKGPYGGVMERYWLSSDIVAVISDPDVPLWVGWNENDNRLLLLKSQYSDSVYANFVDVNSQRPTLDYRIVFPKNPNSTLKDFHLNCMEQYFAFPAAVPDQLMITHPIWSTWARYKKDINQTLVLDFAREIRNNGFENCQLEIDDDWAVAYGDLKMDKNKFPDPKLMISELEKLGYRTTLWVHPFANADSETALEFHQYFVHQADGQLNWNQWWDGVGLSLDATNESAADWFVQRLQSFRDSIGLTSFKFDAGEVNWLGPCFKLSDAKYPNLYSSKYAEMAAKLGNAIEVRVASQTQHLGIFVRLMDKDSRWGHDNGLKSMVASTINFGILGYPFVLPDMVGGNAYGNSSNFFDPNIKPERELFIRWLQASTLLPCIQFSVAPWEYDAHVTSIARKMMSIRAQHVPYMLSLAQEAVHNGAPIIRPLWFLEETQSALTCDSQFLLGESILVAPILDQGAVSREVYLPAGSWKNVLDGQIYAGGQSLQFDCPLEELLYFTIVQ